MVERLTISAIQVPLPFLIWVKKPVNITLVTLSGDNCCGWRSVTVNVVGHINDVKLRRARLVLGLIKERQRWFPLAGAHRAGIHPGGLLRPTQPGQPSNAYRVWFRPSLHGRNGASEITTLLRFMNQFVNIHKNKYSLLNTKLTLLAMLSVTLSDWR